MKKHLEKYRSRLHLSTSFYSIFNKQLHRYLHPIFGFDIVKFDQDIGVPENISMKSFIKDKYGKEGQDLIKTLIEYDSVQLKLLFEKG